MQLVLHIVSPVAYDAAGELEKAVAAYKDGKIGLRAGLLDRHCNVAVACEWRSCLAAARKVKYSPDKLHTLSEGVSIYLSLSSLSAG